MYHIYYTHMFFKSRIFQMIIAVLSIVGYGVFVFSAAPQLSPGQTLDPVLDGLCTGPDDSACNISFANAISIGDVLSNTTAHAVLYNDGNGNLAVDGGFIRNLDTGETSFSTTGALGGSAIYNGQAADGTFTFFGQSVGYEGNYNSVTNGDSISYSINSYADVSSFAAQPAGTSFAQVIEDRWQDASTGDTAFTSVTKLPGVFGGGFSVASEVQAGGTLVGTDIIRSDGTNVDWTISIDDGASIDHGLSFSDTNPLQWTWGSNTIWKMPTIQGSAGQSLVLDADNETLIWDTAGGGGSSPFSVENTSSIFSTGLSGTGLDSVAAEAFFSGTNAGSQAISADYSIFIGYNSGASAPNASFSNFIGSTAGSSAGNATNSNFFGVAAGQNATDAFESNFFGYQAGNGASSADNSNFIGSTAGQNAINAKSSNFIGSGAGGSATNASDSNFFGARAGGDAVNASNSNFFGARAGGDATYASNSNFFGPSAGLNATNAANSIFIGAGSGFNDTVDNRFFVDYSSASGPFVVGEVVVSSSGGNGAIIEDTGTSLLIAPYSSLSFNNSDTITGQASGNTATVDSSSGGGSSILIGYATGTGGYSNSIALGAGAINTTTNQFMLADSITNVRWRGVEYFLPSAQGGSGEVLTNDGSGNLSWAVAGGSSPISIGTSGNTLYSSGLSGTGQGNTSTGGNIILGDLAGASATNVSLSNFFGASAGQNAVNASNSNFFGTDTGKDATNAANAQFFGAGAGLSAENAKNSIFIGVNTGTNDTVDNTEINTTDNCDTTQCWSILLGNNTNTGGFSNSILLGGAASGTYSNTATNQFMLADSITNVRWRGIEYFLPSAQGGSGDVLKNDGTGELFWAPVGGPFSVRNSTSIFSTGLTGTGVGSNAIESFFVGKRAGQDATNASYSNFIGFQAGEGATNATGSSFIGVNAGQGAENATNSIFIGNQAGIGDLVNNLLSGNGDDYAILIGNYASTGGFSNSIALGSNATNTASNQFIIGSTNRPINEIVMVSSGGTTCATDINGTACSSDERLKTNITDLDDSTLDNVRNLRTVTFNWNNNPDADTHIGFIAQNMQEYFPELVSTGSTGYLSVNYAGMTPILTKAIQELDLKIESIETFASSVDTSFIDGVRSWLGDATNGITNLFTKRLTTEEICIVDDQGETCFNRSQINTILGNTEGNNNESSSLNDEEAGDSNDNSEIPTEPEENSSETESDPVSNESETESESVEPEELPVSDEPVESPADDTLVESSDSPSEPSESSADGDDSPETDSPSEGTVE